MFIIKLFLRIDEPQGAISKEALPGTQMMISTHIETAYNTIIRSIIFETNSFLFQWTMPLLTHLLICRYMEKLLVESQK